MKKVVANGKKKVNQLGVIHNKDINLCACRLLLLAVVSPT